MDAKLSWCTILQFQEKIGHKFHPVQFQEKLDENLVQHLIRGMVQ